MPATKTDYYLRLLAALLGLILAFVALAGVFVLKDYESAGIVGIGAAFNFFAAYAAHRRIKQQSTRSGGGA